MENNNKYNDVLGSLSEKKSLDNDFGTTALHDVLGALSTKKEEKKEELKNEEKKADILDIPGFELPEITNEIPTELPIGIPALETAAAEEPVHRPQIKIPTDFGPSMDLNKRENIENHIVDLENENKKLKAVIANQKRENDVQVSRIAELDNQNNKLQNELSNAKDNLRSEFEAQLNKAAIIEEKYNQLAVRHEELKAKVRRDIRKIRLREKELTHKMELIKHDSETLLASKDQKILQLKKYQDSLEFDIETLKEKIETLEGKVKEDDEKAQRVVRALRLSTSLLETNAKKKII
jgi:hypothetical protein